MVNIVLSQEELYYIDEAMSEFVRRRVVGEDGVFYTDFQSALDRIREARFGLYPNIREASRLTP